MVKKVKLPDSLRRTAQKASKIAYQSIARKIGFYFRIALIARVNPDLSFMLIRKIMKAEAEAAAEDYEFS